MAKKVHILKEQQTESILALGLVTADSILQLSMNLNSSYGLNFKLISPVSDNKNSDIKFSCCLHQKDDFLTCYLIKNKQNGNVLFGNYKLIDYILFVLGYDTVQFVENLKSTIKPHGFITTFISVELKKTKGFKHILPL